MAIEIKDRKSLTPDLLREVKRQFAGYHQRDLSGYTFERHGSHYADARANVSIFNAEGVVVIVGRDFSGRYMLWNSSEPLVDER